MPEQTGKYIIHSLQKKWITTNILSGLMSAFGVAFLAYALLYKTTNAAVSWFIPMLLFVSVLFYIVYRARKIKANHVSQYLNQSYPQLEESAGLALKPYDSLNLLEKLQLARTEHSLMVLPVPPILNRKLRTGFLVLVVALLLSLLFTRLPDFLFNKPAVVSLYSTNAAKPPSNANPLPQIIGLSVKINPPAYMHKAAREQENLNIELEEGGTVEWQLSTNKAVPGIQFIFNDSLETVLHSPGNSGISWNTTRTLTAPGYYQVKMGEYLSDLYKIEVTKDQPPVIHIREPKQYTTIDFGQPELVTLSVDLSDDYGIREAGITATIANGSGEAVKFKEQKLDFAGFRSGDKKYDLKKVFQLAEMGMHPGDELYFYVRATDNHQQESRSDMYIVSIPDTAALMSLDGLTLGLRIKPEFFRSERQIIMETEQLIKDKNKLSETEFKNKSNDLGIDQKLLRLRYGKFLGEESETNIPGGEDTDQPELADAKNFGNGTMILDKFSDKHDNAEDASFFEPEIKKQLKATLTEMWNAELPLRTFKPAEALPFEYKALRLLKDLQQKSRAYVAKTSFKSATLKPEKRLTGDLSRISEPITQGDFDSQTDPSIIARLALGLLEQLKAGGAYTKADIENISQAARQINSKAVTEPTIYLPAAQAIRKILVSLQQHTRLPAIEIEHAEKGLQRMVPTPGRLPVSAGSSANEPLSQQYFIHLNNDKKKP